MFKSRLLITFDLYVDGISIVETFEVRDYIDILKKINMMQNEYRSLIDSSTNVWVNLYEESINMKFDFARYDWVELSRGKKKFYKDVVFKGQEDRSTIIQY